MLFLDYHSFFLGFGIIQVFLWHITAEITLTGCHIEDDLEICTFPGGSATTFQLPTQTSTDVKSDLVFGALNTAAPSITEPPASSLPSTGSFAAQTTAVTACHMHGSTHFCITPDGNEVEVIAPKASNENPAPEGPEKKNKDHSKGKNCHFHAGVEHCVSDDESDEPLDCGRHARDYNVSLRIGLLFVILVTSAVGVFSPIFLSKMLKIHPKGMVFTIIKQFGTGIIIATGFIHLLTHAELMFANRCLGELKYESTATSIAMAGAFIAFLVDYFSHRLVQWQISKKIDPSGTTGGEEFPDEEKPEISSRTAGLAGLSHHNHNHGLATTIPTNNSISLLILEAGIIFHSLLIGITLVVAGDSVFITLFIVIIFHQMFEGLALGARIASSSNTETNNLSHYILPLVFSFITPLGMAIGIGVLQSFNGNDKGTIVTLGTLDALSAGILIWVGLVDMWAGDWMFGDLVDASWNKTLVGVFSLVTGFMLMGLLGKWA